MPFCFIACAAAVFLAVFGDGMWRLAGVMVAVCSFFSSIILLAISIVAEYVGQIMTEARHRPTSIIYDYRPAKIVEERS